MNLEVTVKELAKFLEIEPEEAMRRVNDCATSVPRPDNRPNINTAPYWDGIWSREGLQTWRQYPLTFQKIAAHMDKGDTVLDVGCGVGVLLDILKPLCKEVMGLDISPMAIEMLRARGIEGKVGELPHIDFPDKSFDVLIATETLEHMDHPDTLIQEMARVARKRLLLTVPNQVLSPEEIAEHEQLFNRSRLNDLLIRFFTRVTIEEFADSFKASGQNICLPTLLAVCSIKDARKRAQRQAQDCSIITVAEAWNKAKPETPEDVDRFYRDRADSYLYELVSWNCTSPVYAQWNAPLLGYHGKKILEIGAGIGTLCIQLAYAGNDVTYCDINLKLKAFAKQRFEERGLYIPIVSNLRTLRDFDMVVANDFFEHVHKDSLPKLLKQIAGCLKDGGFVYHRSNFKQQDIFPMHFDHSEYFTKMARDANLIERPNGDLVKGGESRGVHVGVPMLGPMSDEWFYSFVGLNKPPGTKLTKVASRPADVARNDIIKQLEKDWLFFMDADQTFHPDTLKKLLSWDLPIVSGLYFKSPGNPVPHCYKYAYQENTEGPVKDAHFYAALTEPITLFLLKHTETLKKSPEAVILPSTKDDLIECDGVGAGCLLIHRRVLDAIEPPWFEYNPGTFVGEDFYFCRKVQAAGFKIFVDPGVICGHKMKGFIGAEHFLNFLTTKGKKIDDVYPYPWKEPGE